MGGKTAMDIQTLQSFFMWCTVLNLGILIIAGLFLAIGSDFVYWVKSRFFTIPREQFDVVIYCWVAFYKMIVIVFNVVPWIALEIIG
jgi:hypothetical protein